MTADIADTLTAAYNHIVNGHPVSDDAMKECATLIADDATARDAIIMCAISPDATADLALAFVQRPCDKKVEQCLNRMHTTVFNGDNPIRADRYQRAILFVERMRDLSDIEHRNEFTTIIAYLAWITNDTEALTASFAALDETQPLPALACIVRLDAKHGGHGNARISA